jgi:hypothetical protein
MLHARLTGAKMPEMPSPPHLKIQSVFFALHGFIGALSKECKKILSAPPAQETGVNISRSTSPLKHELEDRVVPAHVGIPRTME